MPYARTSLRKEKRDLREKMRGLGLGYRDIAAEFARRYNLRPRAAWREAYGWSLQETADRINEFRGQVGLDPGGLASMTARVAPEPMPRACNPSRIGRSSHDASSETSAISSAIALTIQTDVPPMRA